AEVRDRARDSRCRPVDPRATQGHLPDLLRRPEHDGAADPVAPELRHQRQDLLRLHRAGRGHGARARAAGWLPGQRRGCGHGDHRPDDRRGL
ncbi:MAG: hypothetical protein AVDCRST_MAG88-108, partial [uncultured Thermomicrobiales bacterium]